MKLKKIQLKDFRPFKQLEMEFGEKITVLVGINGSGKSSILDLLAIMLSRLLGRIRSSKGTGRFFSDTDIRQNSNETVNTITIEFKQELISWKMVKTKRGRKKQTTTNLAGIKNIVENIHESLERDENSNIPLAIFYGVNRSVLDIPLNIRIKHEFGQVDAYEQALTVENNHFHRFFEWYRKREDFENEQIISTIQNENLVKKSNLFQDPQLKAVRNAIHILTGFANLKIKRNPLRMEVKKGTKTFDIRQLSDGEKCFIALVGDLAHRLAIANPSLNNPLDGLGIVLIDEIDLHLHPEWQHKIIPKLLETFPNCQFVVTTHSPQVISHVSCQNIWCLIQNEDENTDIIRPDGTYGQDSNFLLRTLMGSSYRPEEIETKIDLLFNLIKQDTLQARELLNQLKAEVEGESPDLVRAQVLLHRREVMEKNEAH